jgi:hypothetical protein
VVRGPHHARSVALKPHYERVGLMKYFGGAAAPDLTGDDLIRDLETAA